MVFWPLRPGKRPRLGASARLHFPFDFSKLFSPLELPFASDKLREAQREGDEQRANADVEEKFQDSIKKKLCSKGNQYIFFYRFNFLLEKEFP